MFRFPKIAAMRLKTIEDLRQIENSLELQASQDEFLAIMDSAQDQRDPLDAAKVYFDNLELVSKLWNEIYTLRQGQPSI